MCWLPLVAQADGEVPAAESWNVFGQVTYTRQWHDDFRSPYEGAHSLDPSADSAETTDATLLLGLRLWRGASAYLNPEIDQGFGLSNTLGVAGFPSGEAYKIGANAPYLRLPRAFVRQVIDLGGDAVHVDSAPNQISGDMMTNRLTITAGKFAVTDMFDTNTYAHDPRGDFLNWAAIDAAVFDYAADAWGYTYGAALEWTADTWSARLGLFDLSTVPNGKQPDPAFGQFEEVVELEERHHWGEHPGKLKLLLFSNHARMGSYGDALALAAATGTVPATAAVRRFQSRAGVELNLEQELAPKLGAFLRVGVNDGSKEAYEFTDVNRSVSGGVLLYGGRWGRPDDSIGLALIENGLSRAAQDYFAAGGLGVLVGDGRLDYGHEQIAETFYALRVTRHVTTTLDYQWIGNPAYNRDRGPVSIVGARVHADF